MLLDEILKTKDFQDLKKERNKNAFPKALLLISKDSAYLAEFAKAVAMLVMDGEMDLDSENCKKILAGSHPDLKFYPTKDKLMVADSEEIGEESFVKPIFSDKKVFIINNFESSMESAQNKLLKVLEEPTKNVYLILTCTNPNLVLPTIRSRCNKVELAKLNDGQVEALLPKLDDNAKALVLACSDGQVGKALKLAKMKNFEALCTSAVGVFTQMKNSKHVLRFSKELLSYKEDISLLLDIFALAIEDLIKIKSNQLSLIRLAPYLDELKGCQGDYTVRALCQIAPLIDKVAMEKSYNVNVTVSLENLLLNILEVKYLCK